MALFSATFEVGDLSEFTGNDQTNATIAASNADAHHGSWSAAFASLDAWTDAADVYTDLGATYASLFTRAQFKVAAEPSFDGWGFTIGLYGTNHLCKVIYDATNDFWGVRYTDGAWKNTWGAVASPIVAATWFSLELEVSVDAAAGYFKVWKDDVLVANPAGIKTDAMGNVGRVYIGEVYLDGNEATGDHGYVDCVVVDTAFIGMSERVASHRTLVGVGV